MKCFIFVVGFLLGRLPTLRPPTGSSISMPGGALDENMISSTTPNAKDNSDEGWKCVDVFYGKKIVENIPPNTSMTQANQDKIVAALFRGKRNGYFVDLAANNAIDMSNTYPLERQYGWKGLCIEPNPTYWRNLTSYRDCQVAAAVAGQSGMEEVHFHFDLWGGVGGGIVGSGFDNKPARAKTSLKMYTVTVQDILRRHEAPAVIDYLSLDVEGAEDFVMKYFPFDQYSIHVLTVERPSKQSFFTIMEGQGYNCVGRISSFGETLWIHKDSEAHLDMSSVDKHTARSLQKCRPLR